ncbi:Pre-splicing factor cwc21 [Sesamum alatum]|uniref:Pre-splicing factor cwc21 n=1 Tax=Sesamum alatum TaxID=300844 RepID=A0AAE1Y2Q5_9LAMI|nr:Pre-splicing factor cwc21 [Sesamum alatum]
MYGGIGLQTPQGSGTNGFIQLSKFFVKPKTKTKTNTNTYSGKGFEWDQGTAGATRQSNKQILEHDRKRKIQLKILVNLIDHGYTDAEKLDEAKDSEDLGRDAHEAPGFVDNSAHRHKRRRKII